jgi:hypothetical protein
MERERELAEAHAWAATAPFSPNIEYLHRVTLDSWLAQIEDKYSGADLASTLAKIEAKYKPAPPALVQPRRRGSNGSGRQRAMANRLAHASYGRKTWRGNMWGR